MCWRPQLEKQVATILHRLNGELEDLDLEVTIPGFWIEPALYSDDDEVTVLLLVQFLVNDEDFDESELRESIERMTELRGRVADAFSPLILPISPDCWFTTPDDFESLGPPMNPDAFRRMETLSPTE